METTITREEREHKEKISENYARIINGTAAVAPEKEAERTYTPVYPNYIAQPKADPANRVAPQADPVNRAQTPVYVPSASNVSRIADYKAHAPARVYEDRPYQGQEVVMHAAVVEAPRPAVLPQQAPALDDLTEEDVLPTLRTMQTLTDYHHGEEEKVGFFAALSARTRMTLIALATCIVVFLAMIIVNAAILSSLEGQIAAQERENARLEQEHGTLQNDVDNLLDSDTIAEWAQKNGMHR